MPRVVLAIRARPKGVSLKPAVSLSPEPLRLELPGRDRLQCHHQVVQAPGAREAHGVGGLEHRGGGAQRCARGARRDEGQILPRRDTGPATEQAVEVKFRQVRGGRHRREARLRAEMAVDVADRPCDAVEIAAVEETAGTVIHGSHDRAPVPADRPESCAAGSAGVPAGLRLHCRAMRARSATGAASAPRLRRCRRRPRAEPRG